MSCYVCSNLTTASVALTCLQIGGREADPATLQKLGDLLRAENVRSVNYRYGEDDSDPFELPDAETLAKLAELPDLQKLGAIRCYRYQTCETPEWESTPAIQIVHAAMKALQDLTGTERGKGWGVTLADLAANSLETP
jgi:hypothetical protein